MAQTARQRGFSLTEVLLATGVLAVGFALIATVFPVGVMLTTAAAERTIGPVAAQEAAAKVRLYGVDLRDQAARVGRAGLTANGMRVFDRDILRDATYQQMIGALPAGLGMTPADVDLRLHSESFYPSLPDAYYQNTQETRNYRWVVLCQKTEAHNNPQNVRLRIFVCRNSAGNSNYYGFTYNSAANAYAVQRNLSWPMPVPVAVVHDDTIPVNADVLVLRGQADQVVAYMDNELGKFFADDCQVINGSNGDLYRVVERRDADNNGINETLILDKPFVKSAPGTATNETIWVVPPAQSSGRNPCIGIYTETVWMN